MEAVNYTSLSSYSSAFVPSMIVMFSVHNLEKD